MKPMITEPIFRMRMKAITLRKLILYMNLEAVSMGATGLLRVWLEGDPILRLEDRLELELELELELKLELELELELDLV